MSRRPRTLSLRTACACWAAAGRNAASRASQSPSSIPAIFWARWSNSKSVKGEESHEDQARRADRSQLSHEEAGLHGGRRDQTGGQCAPRIEADNGVVGWGEAASAPTMTGETGESTMAAIGYLTPALEGRPAEDIAGALAAMAARMYANNGAKAAVEIALHDLVGRATNQPAYALLGGKQRSRMA